MVTSLLRICVLIAGCSLLAYSQDKTAIASTANQSENSASDIAELTKLASDAGHAYASRNLAALERLTADDYVQTDVRGGVLNRTQWLEFVKNRKSDLTVETDNVHVSVYGNTAVVRGHWIYHRQADGVELRSDSQWTSMWTRDGDGWKRHAFQNTYVNADADHCASVPSSLSTHEIDELPTPMRSIFNLLAGSWSITWSDKDGHVIGEGEEVWKFAPGATALIEENRSKVKGKSADDYASMWWDGKARRVHGIWCDGSINDEGCSGFDVTLEGNDVVLTGEWKFQGKRQAWREVLSGTNANMTQTLYVGEPGKQLTLASTISGRKR
jgi:ketosteroid isomerase-like protein